MKTGLLRTLVLCLSMLLIFPAFARADILTIDPDTVLHEVSPTLYGIFIEDIN